MEEVIGFLVSVLLGVIVLMSICGLRELLALTRLHPWIETTAMTVVFLGLGLLAFAYVILEAPELWESDQFRPISSISDLSESEG